MDQISDKRELFLIIQLLRYWLHGGTEAATQIVAAANAPELDWNEFLRLAKFHKVYIHIFDIIKELNCFPENVLFKLKEMNVSNARKSLAITNELKFLSGLLNGNGINFVIFKGQPLSTLLYGSAHRRGSKDIDLLIDGDDLDKLMRLFADDYQELYPLELPLKYVKLYYKHLFYINKRTRVVVEVHWKMLHNTQLAPGLDGDTLQHAVTIDFAEDKINIPDFNHHLFYCLLHGAKHCWFRLFWLLDMAEFCRKDEFDKEKLLALGEKYGVANALESSLLLCNQLFLSPRLENDYQALLSGKRKIKQLRKIYLDKIAVGELLKNVPYIETIKRKADLIRMELLLKKDIKYLGELISLHLISPEDIKTLPLPQKLFFLYYPLHFVFATARWYNIRKRVIKTDTQGMPRAIHPVIEDME